MAARRLVRSDPVVTARLGRLGQVGRGSLVRARQARRVVFDAVRYSRLVQVRQAGHGCSAPGPSCQNKARLTRRGTAGNPWRGTSWCRESGLGLSGQARQGGSWLYLAWQAWQSLAWGVPTWQGSVGQVWPVVARQGTASRAGKAWCGVTRLGFFWQAGQGSRGLATHRMAWTHGRPVWFCPTGRGPSYGSRHGLARQAGQACFVGA